MARLPVPGSDKNTWGNILNEFLGQSHKDDGSLRDGVVATGQVSDGAISSAKLAGDVQAAINAAVTEVTLDKQWTIVGSINVASGDVDYIAPAYLVIPAGFSATITTVRARINSGTNANIAITRNGSNLSGLGSVTVTTLGVVVSGLSLAVADADLLAPVVNSTSGGPQNMTVMVSYKLIKT